MEGKEEDGNSQCTQSWSGVEAEAEKMVGSCSTLLLGLRDNKSLSI